MTYRRLKWLAALTVAILLIAGVWNRINPPEPVPQVFQQPNPVPIMLTNQPTLSPNAHQVNPPPPMMQTGLQTLIPQANQGNIPPFLLTPPPTP